MFQSFDVVGGPDLGRANLPRLRERIAAMGLDGFIIPHADEYDNEYLPACNERLMWATGFTGSAGAAVVMPTSAVVFVDGRYTLQAKDQVDADLFTVADLVETGVTGWIAAEAPRGAHIGYDARLHSPKAVEAMEAAAKKAGVVLVSVDVNPIDAVWADRPAAPSAPAVVHPLDAAGEAHPAKRARMGEAVKAAGADAAALTDPHSVCWLLNLRGADVSHTPLLLAQAILHADGRVELFVDPAKIGPEVKAHLGGDVTVLSPADIANALKSLAGHTVMLDPANAAAWWFQIGEAAGVTVLREADPTALPRATKNAAEVAGAFEAHRRDGAALTQFLKWLAETAPEGGVDEIGAATQLEEFRRGSNALQDLSFDSISGSGPHGAIVHYRVTTATNRALNPGELYLIDSGGQYRDGTTDVTRTALIGGAPAAGEMIRAYTLVLKGHIALSVARFPKGTSGAQLDALARAPLWAAGLDYDHGTGHGVGSFLSVHEGPQRISKAPNTVALQPGMIVSNEPGYYKEGGFGIRIENLQVVTPAEPVPGGERDMLGFETLTLAPLERELIDANLLTDDERAWVNAYHARVRAEIGPRLNTDDLEWLKGRCATL